MQTLKLLHKISDKIKVLNNECFQGKMTEIKQNFT